MVYLYPFCGLPILTGLKLIPLIGRTVSNNFLSILYYSRGKFGLFSVFLRYIVYQQIANSFWEIIYFSKDKWLRLNSGHFNLKTIQPVFNNVKTYSVAFKRGFSSLTFLLIVAKLTLMWQMPSLIVFPVFSR